MKANATRALIALALSCVSAQAFSAKAPQLPFEDALSYTALIKTTVRWPFNDERRGTSKGAGFLVSKSKGWIMTNAHVAARSHSSISLSFLNSDPMPAEKLYVDPFLDIALIKVDPSLLPADIKEARLECDNLPQTGVAVGAMGHPGGFSFTATKGVISGVTSRLSTEFIQTDAPINPGNSGGPLIDLADGRVVGVNTAIIKGAQNTNFATASKYACRILRLLEQGRDPSPFKNGWAFMREQEEPRLVRVAKIRGGDDPMGALPDDVIALAGSSKTPVRNETQLVHALRGESQNAEVTVLRSGSPVALKGALGLEPRVIERAGYVVSGALFAEVKEDFSDDIASGPVAINFVEEGSLAENAEVAKDDFVMAVNGVEPKSLQEFARLIEQAPGPSATLKLKRINAGTSGLFGYIERKVTLRERFWVKAADPMGGK